MQANIIGTEEADRLFYEQSKWMTRASQVEKLLCFFDEDVLMSLAASEHYVLFYVVIILRRKYKR